MTLIKLQKTEKKCTRKNLDDTTKVTQIEIIIKVTEFIWILNKVNATSEAYNF